MLVVVDTAVLAAARQWKFLFVSCLFAFESIFALGVPAFSLMRPWSGCGAVHLIEITCAERFCVVPHLEGEGEGSVEAVCFCVNHTGGAVEFFFLTQWEIFVCWGWLSGVRMETSRVA